MCVRLSLTNQEIRIKHLWTAFARLWSSGPLVLTELTVTLSGVMPAKFVFLIINRISTFCIYFPVLLSECQASCRALHHEYCMMITFNNL